MTQVQRTRAVVRLYQQAKQFGQCPLIIQQGTPVQTFNIAFMGLYTVEHIIRRRIGIERQHAEYQTFERVVDRPANRRGKRQRFPAVSVSIQAPRKSKREPSTGTLITMYRGCECNARIPLQQGFQQRCRNRRRFIDEYQVCLLRITQ